MLALKPFIRITILSIILTFLLIYLGIKYHWVDHFKTNSDGSIELSLPDKKIVEPNVNADQANNSNLFDPEIIKNNTSDTVLISMNKEQITEHCINLMSKELKDPLLLELATVNCVMSNHQETFQEKKELSNNLKVKMNKNKLLFNQQCRNTFNQNTQASALEKQLLVGICVSDKLSIN